jgi:hypothetical protein
MKVDANGIGAIDSRQRDYHIFTDEGVDELIGLLRFPVERIDEMD